MSAREYQFVDLARDAIVIRFTPTDREKVLNKARIEKRRLGVAGLSVFAAEADEGESEEDVLHRLLEASELAGIDSARNRKYFVCTSAGEILDRGFRFYKEPADPDEIDEHYGVDLGDDPTTTTVDRFLESFSNRRR